MLCYPTFRYLKSFHVTDNEKSFSNGVSRVLLSLPGSFLKDGYLHLLLIDLVAKEDNLFVFAVNIHSGKPFQASFASSSRESGSKNSCFDDECNSRVNDFDIICHNLSLELNRMMEIVN